MIQPGMVRSISELALWVQDLERAVAFYVDNLGFTGRVAGRGNATLF